MSLELLIEAPAKEEPPTADDPGEGERPGVVSGSSDTCSICEMESVNLIKRRGYLICLTCEEQIEGADYEGRKS